MAGSFGAMLLLVLLLMGYRVLLLLEEEDMVLSSLWGCMNIALVDGSSCIAAAVDQCGLSP